MHGILNKRIFIIAMQLGATCGRLNCSLM